MQTVTYFGTTTRNPRRSRLLLDGDCIFADILKPHVVQSARAEAVDTLSLIGTNNDVRKCGTLFEKEDGVIVAAL
jgi:hypothetical protein